ncbi:putative leucine-rich repeat-containing protein DDB_G0290503 isoform X3 [Drosophila sulfurigaster albostrigata]|uniref:putative leucine-rich repeat-containing protein DDB_G0290503 isoform X3 n=1 Tax=Drosophila sulfurigaster albostrigata TaxID=89887 RepID=UPI002D21D272|nr:putative leucine-rich repeat-containing protein DDB_G0290503 isoform X3 [Drosophila sulfurigaster albostrigata]
MAENQLKTTSSKGFFEKTAHVLMSHNGTVRKMEHDQLSRTKQSFQPDKKHDATEDCEALVLSKNKLKRKKKLSASLTSVGDTVNQEKRTRIEGIHLNIKPRHEITTVHSAKAPAKQTVERNVERPVIIGGVNVLSAAPQRFKRKLQENVDTIQKLNALAEQLRLEVNELKSSLITERGAVRALRAQNDADSRKWRCEVKKLQQTLETTKKSNLSKKPNELASEVNSHVAADGLINYEIQRLTNEIAVLKEANKTKEEKTQLEEIKTKERNIGQLKKDLQTLQNGKKFTEAKTKPKTNESSQKLKRPTTKSQKATTIPTITIAPKAINETDILPIPLNQAQVTAEITQLKNIELINNTKNVHKSTLEVRTTKAKQPHEQHEQKPEEKNQEEFMMGEGIEAESEVGAETETAVAATTWMGTLLSSSTPKTKKPTLREYRSKDNNSDTDSALSSAPSSISPQPPSSGADSGVMWQALQDLDKLQKEVEIYHKENERLHTELQLMKQELLNAENAVLSTSNNNKHINQLLQRIKDMEEQQLQLTDQSNELREQNELLEFRILELEDDKMDDNCKEHCQRLENLLRKRAQQLEDKDKRCLKQLLQCVQQLDLDAMAEQDGWQSSTKSERGVRHNNSRIVATVQPYTNSVSPSTPSTPNKQQRPCNIAWQSSSLSESGVFVECDSERETFPDREQIEPHHQEYQYPHPHLAYYQERLIQLEGKLLVYESSGDSQAKHLAERLQREVQLNKQVKDLIERVELLVEQNAQLDEAKCEFEEAENDTRLHLQHNEEELEILRQRNVELEFGKDALGAKYRDCRAECLILREDLCAAETQLEHLQGERQRTKQQLENLRRSLPLLLICHLLALARTKSSSMGNDQSIAAPAANRTTAGACKCNPCKKNPNKSSNAAQQGPSTSREVNYLKEEVKNLRTSLQELNTRHYEAMETADSHWVDLEREYKAREDAYRTKEVCLKQKINKLQDCLRDDSRAAAEKIQQLEESEHGLKTCLVRLSKEHRDLIETNRALEKDMESRAAQERQAQDQVQPLTEELENEKRRSQALIDDLSFAKKLQQSMEEQLKAETDCLRQQIYDLKKELMHIEVTNGELKEEVGTLETKIAELQQQLKDCEEHACCLEDELRTKDEQIQRMERKLGTCPEGHSLADELYDSPEKRAKRDEINDLQAARQGLGCALRDLERRERELPTHKDFQTIACSVKQLADTILSAQKPEVSQCECEGAEAIPIPICETKRKQAEEDTKKEGEKIDEDADKKEVEEKQEEESEGEKEEGENKEDGEKNKDDNKDEQSKQEETKEESKEVPAEDTASDAKVPEDRISGGFSRRRQDANAGSLGLDISFIGKQLKRQIAEVPTTLRRLVCGKMLVNSSVKKKTETLPKKRKYQKSDWTNNNRVRRRRRNCKRFVSRRIFRGRVRLCGASCRPIQLQTRRCKSLASFHSVASMHTAHSDKSGATTSRTQYVKIIDRQWEQPKFNGLAQTEPTSSQCQLVQVSPEMRDEELQTQWITHECGIQADNVGVDHRLLMLPSRTRAFLELLQSRLTDEADFDVNVFRCRVLQLWEGSEEFREHIELLQDLCTEHASKQASYDIFVGVLGCVRALKFILKPSNSPLLHQLEQSVNERLTSYHNQKVESEFYCTIYLPVERPNPLHLAQKEA